MTESFLHYLWKNRLFRFLQASTTDGEPITIFFPGYHNTDAGPDFKNAIIQIGDIKWAGDVEIHLRSSDWFRHKHHLDDKYKSVTLHVVFEHDCEVERMPGECFPTLELKDLIPEEMYARYEQLIASSNAIGCFGMLEDMDALRLCSVSTSMAVERLLNKQLHVIDTVQKCAGDWQEAFYRQLALGFGFKTNASAFELLAISLPFKILSRHTDSQLQVNALVFGQAGLLCDSPLDLYHDQLKYEYDYLRYKYQLVPIEPYHWNLLRMRPPNFPCVRLAQFASLLCKIPKMMQEVIDNPNVGYLQRRFVVEANEYWRSHYHFGKENLLPHGVLLGKSSVELLLINTVIPFLFAYYKYRGEEGNLERVLEMLEQLPFEDNKLTRCFASCPFPKKSALDSQALIELLQNYCRNQRCLDCAIGVSILQGAENKNGCP